MLKSFVILVDSGSFCGKYRSAQIMTDVARMTVPAVRTKSFPFSYRRHARLCSVGMR